ncbi:hypothetical protein CLOM_g13826, partial [Closterium sp. NIES-68]
KMALGNISPRAMFSHAQPAKVVSFLVGVVAILATLCPVTAARSVALADWQALLRLREELNFTNPQRSPKVYWRSRDNCNVIFGVSCDDQGRVVTLSLWGVTGPLPESIANLTALTSLWVGNNVTSIPSSLAQLSSTLSALDWQVAAAGDAALGWKSLSGPIPSLISSLSALSYLSLASNDLSGAIPPQISALQALQYIDLRNNLLSGAIPPQIGNNYNLNWLYLSNNRLSGFIPASIGRIDRLRYMFLDSNVLSGLIPESVSTLSALVYLDLSFNALTGPLPSSLSSCGSLYTLDVSSNALSGSPSTTVSAMPSLSYLNLSNNFFTGLVPRVVDSQQMVSYDISSNYFYGPGLVSDTTPLALPLCKTGFEPGTFSAAANCLVYGSATENSCPTRTGPMSTGDLLQVDAQRSEAACLSFCRTNITRTAANSQCGSLGTCVMEMTGSPPRPSYACECAKGAIRSADGQSCTAIASFSGAKCGWFLGYYKCENHDEKQLA